MQLVLLLCTYLVYTIWSQIIFSILFLNIRPSICRNAKLTVIECRGQLGVPLEEGEKTKDQKAPNGEGVEKGKKDQESGRQDVKESFAGCCQGADGGITCCRDGSLEKSDKSEEKKRESCSKEGPLCPLSSWIGKLEQRDVLTAAAVVGAVATVAVAYSHYRRPH